MKFTSSCYLCAKIYHYQHTICFSGQQQHYLYWNLSIGLWFISTEKYVDDVIYFGTLTDATDTFFKKTHLVAVDKRTCSRLSHLAAVYQKTMSRLKYQLLVYKETIFRLTRIIGSTKYIFKAYMPVSRPYVDRISENYQWKWPFW